MTTGASYHSDEELIKRLQIVLRDYRDVGGDLNRRDNDIREVRNLAAALAERIYDEPSKWGIADIQPEFRDDASSDALIALLTGIPEFKGRQTVSDWFRSNAESQFRRLWAVSERQTREPATDASDDSLAAPEASEGTTSVFEENSDLWQRFEGEFPRDAFALRLRYLLNRTPDEIAVMLDAPSVRAINIRVNRARDRFRMFCEQTGFDRRELADIMERFPEDQAS